MNMVAAWPKDSQQAGSHPSNRADRSGNMVVLMEHEAFNTTFKALYQRGMQLIEEVGHYINEDGRAAMCCLPDDAAALYSTEAIHLGSRLMQVASWLLLERALRDRDMKPDYVAKEKKKIKLNLEYPRFEHEAWSELPQKFRDLVTESIHLVERVRHLNNEDDVFEQKNESADVIKLQLSRLEQAFGVKN